MLITQFDPEHISGFLQTGRVRPGDGIRTVYLPDLFSERWMNEVLALLLLQDLSRGGFLPGKAVTLTSLMEVLLTFPGRLCFLKRGESIGGRYQVLWPQKDGLKAEMEQTLKSAGILDAFYEQDRCMWRELVRVSSRMREIYMRSCIPEARMFREMKKESRWNWKRTSKTSGRTSESCVETSGFLEWWNGARNILRF